MIGRLGIESNNFYGYFSSEEIEKLKNNSIEGTLLTRGINVKILGKLTAKLILKETKLVYEIKDKEIVKNLDLIVSSKDYERFVKQGQIDLRNEEAQLIRLRDTSRLQRGEETLYKRILESMEDIRNPKKKKNGEFSILY